MKQDTADTFVRSPGETRGGELFLRTLIALGDDRPHRIVLVGHSCGAVFVNQMLKATRAARRSGDLPADFAFSGVVFMAPACTYRQFAEVLPGAVEPPLFEQFRMFTMDDEHERRDHLVPLVYPRSLLYLISGALEDEPDTPILGMDRYCGRAAGAIDAYGDLGLPEIASVRAYLKAAGRAVWSPNAKGAAGFRADAVSHGGFDDTGADRRGAALPRATIDSVRHILEKGWG